MISTPSPPQPQPPGPPPNPPMFLQSQAANELGARTGAQINPAAGFGGTILGQSNPSNTGQKTLLGQ